EERKSVRTLMQWSSQKNGGFSDAPTKKLVTKIISDGEFSYKKINVDDQQRDADSLLNWLRRAISMRKESPEFGWGDYEVIETKNRQVLAHCCSTVNGNIIAVHNFSDQEVCINLNFEKLDGMMNIFGDLKYDPFDPKSKELVLSPY